MSTTQVTAVSPLFIQTSSYGIISLSEVDRKIIELRDAVFNLTGILSLAPVTECLRIKNDLESALFKNGIYTYRPLFDDLNTRIHSCIDANLAHSRQQRAAEDAFARQLRGVYVDEERAERKRNHSGEMVSDAIRVLNVQFDDKNEEEQMSALALTRRRTIGKLSDAALQAKPTVEKKQKPVKDLAGKLSMMNFKDEFKLN